MRYKIIKGQVQESMWIDAPYDSKDDALYDLNNGIDHACEKCDLNQCPTLSQVEFDRLTNYNKFED